MEELAAVIAKELLEACRAVSITVEAVQQVRGGLSFVARAGAEQIGDNA